MLLFYSSVFAQNPPFETDTLKLESPYLLLVTTYNDPGVYPPEIAIEILNTNTNEVVFYEEAEEFVRGFVYGKSHFKLGGKSTAILEFQPNTVVQEKGNLILILTPQEDSVYRSVIQTHGYYEIKNLDADSENELVISEHLFNRLNVRGCQNNSTPSIAFEGSLVPEIYEWQGDSLFKVQDPKLLITYYNEYISQQEKMFEADNERYISHYKDYSKPNVPTLLDYAQYFYLCKLAGKKKKYPLEFFQKHNKLFMYICRDIPARSFTIDTSLSRFFEAFGKEIIFSEEGE